ncbi:MAG: SDR family NAD(P)-dependent oxidoreductase [Eggerthellaceae bacterium]|jgi:NAD(P)-dependent dehydrogenase (short-subunit alcohol dehydrogenase family)
MAAKVWFITGASSGLGFGIAMAALERGDKAVVTARDIERLDSLMRRYPHRALPIALELADEASRQAAVAKALAHFGSIDVLVNNAGHGYRAAVEESEPDRVRELFDVNYFGPMDLTCLVLPTMRKHRSGLIINVTSIGAVRGALGNGYYSGAKGALELTTEALGKEVAGLGIRTMLVEPGAMDSGFYGDRMGGTLRHIGDYDPLGRRYRKEFIEGAPESAGDPVAYGKVVVDIALDDEPPQRLLLGADAVAAAESTLAYRLDEVGKWRAASTLEKYA